MTDEKQHVGSCTLEISKDHRILGAFCQRIQGILAKASITFKVMINKQKFQKRMILQGLQ
ncbi:hypothetical protein A11S_1225 [Micavibrio aeruginosavorus EPB]|uniref:Uncharacterized protein n=1 Tax=Micavibrio aeruginosavorus EPB TaxID=349215 RepID=M4VFS1_9BACT|nr:hypothetical protein A11S_1225 [Micavibrio aeruginosavorus EPB]